MTTIAVLMLISGMLPLFASALSKVGGAAYDNNAPRSWLARQEGWRSRANDAQANLFEGLPLLYAAVLFALYRQADLGTLTGLLAAWIVVRLLYIGAYVAGYGTVRTAVWALALLLNASMLFI